MMTLRVSAAEIYPGQEIAIQQTIKVVQHYEQVLAFGEIAPLQVPAVEKQPDGGGSLDGAVKDVSHKDAGETQKASITQPIIPDGSSPTESIQVTSEDVIVPEVKSQEEKVATGAKIQEPVADVVKDSGDNILKKPKRPDLSSIKVMKANTGEFLEKRIDQE